MAYHIHPSTPAMTMATPDRKIHDYAYASNPFVADEYAPAPHTGPRHRVRSFVDSVVSPFINCVSPPVRACARPAHTHEDHFTEPWRQQPAHHSHQTYPSPPHHHRPFVTPPHSDRERRTTSVGPYPYYMPTESSPVDPSRGGVPPYATHTIPSPRSSDILCGRGGSTSQHVGNIRFRELIAANKLNYSGLTKKQKMQMARQVVDLIRLGSGGRFLARDPQTGQWYDIGLSRSLEKVSQALREKSSMERQQQKQQYASAASEERADSPTESDSPSRSSDTTVKTGTTRSFHSHHKENVSGGNRRAETPPLVIPLKLQPIYQSAAPQHHASYPPVDSAYGSPYPPPPYFVPPVPHSNTLQHQAPRPPTIKTLKPMIDPAIRSRSERLAFQSLEFAAATVDDSMVNRSRSFSSSGSSHSRSSPTSPTHEQVWKRARTEDGSAWLVKTLVSPQAQSRRMATPADVPTPIPATNHSFSSSSSASPPASPLDNAMGSKLSLEDRIIRRTPPPVIVPPSRVGWGRQRPMQEDGLAALSAAAFLRLDEAE